MICVNLYLVLAALCDFVPLILFDDAPVETASRESYLWLRGQRRRRASSRRRRRRNTSQSRAKLSWCSSGADCHAPED
jgi:hypothetical protein